SSLVLPVPRQRESRLEEARLMVRPCAQHGILEYGQILQEPRLLEGAGDAEPGSGLDVLPGKILVPKQDAAVIHPVIAADHVEQRGLPAAVGAYEPMDLPWPDLDAHVAQRLQAAEA